MKVRPPMIASTGLIFLAVAAFAILAAAGLFLWASGGIQSPDGRVGRVIRLAGAAEGAPQTPPKEITILSWNAAFGHGRGSDGAEFERKPKEEIARRLARMAEIIRAEGADVVLLHEVDFGSRRSHFLDEAVFLAERAGLEYAAPAVSWKAGHVPYPYWPPRRHFGRMLSGGAILSRFPILGNEYRLLPKPAENPWYYNAFYLFRYCQIARIEINGKVLSVANLHLEAFKASARMRQAGQIAASIRDKALLAFGGDFNTLPLPASKKRGFDDEPDADFTDDRTLSVFDSLPDYREAVAPDEYLKNESDYFTFPAEAPSRRLDYLFVRREQPILSVKIIKTGDLSDHLPVIVKIGL